MNSNFETTGDPLTNRIPSDDVKDVTVSTLNGLIAICKDGEAGFAEANENVERSDLKALFTELSGQRAQFAGGLQTLVSSLGEEPANSGHVSAALHRAWIDIKGAFTGKDEGSILNECERGEDSAKKAYETALKEPLPDFVRETVQKQADAVLAAHDRIKALRDAANSTKSQTAKPGIL